MRSSFSYLSFPCRSGGMHECLQCSAVVLGLPAARQASSGRRAGRQAGGWRAGGCARHVQQPVLLPRPIAAGSEVKNHPRSVYSGGGGVSSSSSAFKALNSAVTS